MEAEKVTWHWKPPAPVMSRRPAGGARAHGRSPTLRHLEKPHEHSVFIINSVPRTSLPLHFCSSCKCPPPTRRPDRARGCPLSSSHTSLLGRDTTDGSALSIDRGRLRRQTPGDKISAPESQSAFLSVGLAPSHCLSACVCVPGPHPHALTLFSICRRAGNWAEDRKDLDRSVNICREDSVPKPNLLSAPAGLSGIWKMGEAFSRGTSSGSCGEAAGPSLKAHSVGSLKLPAFRRNCSVTRGSHRAAQSRPVPGKTAMGKLTWCLSPKPL